MSSPHDTSYETLKSPRNQAYVSPPYSRSSTESDDSLRALELSEGPLLHEGPRSSRSRSYSVAGFDFQSDLLPLSASLSEPENHREPKEKTIGLINGERYLRCTWRIIRVKVSSKALHSWLAYRYVDSHLRSHTSSYLLFSQIGSGIL